MKTKIIRKTYSKSWDYFESEINEFIETVDLVDIKLTEIDAGDFTIATALIIYTDFSITEKRLTRTFEQEN